MMRYINLRFTYLLTYLLTIPAWETRFYWLDVNDDKSSAAAVPCLFAVLYPSMSSPPKFIGPVILTNGTYPDYYFECQIYYKGGTTDDGSRFDVVLTADDQPVLSTLRTVTSLQKTVVFTSADTCGIFGTKVSKTKHFYLVVCCRSLSPIHNTVVATLSTLTLTLALLFIWVWKTLRNST